MHSRIKLLLVSLLLCASSAIASANEYVVKPVVYEGLVANLYLPNGVAKAPVVIAFGGSDGGLNGGDANGELLAPHGVAVLALAYFKADGIPPTLDRIPLEYFIRAIDYLETVRAVDAGRIGVVSGSRGSEAALLLASIDARIKSVVVTTPSNVAWYGKTTPRSAWTFKGKDVPALSLELDESAPTLSRFEAALKNAGNVHDALFAVEHINGPLLMVSAEQDQIWPSFRMAEDIQAYLAAHHFKHSVTHSSYPTGHGFSKETAPEIKQSIIDHFVRTL
jgi:dienelactone hydrolase